ncbi:1074_t:CDS:2 [Diversispora eburnea]|uniref:1074_t:CDS:1 n=1 Tax=Diversispora eburnea TaxID=1213867 RepID=A0A9N8ZZV4_9GLOM|nr:1074_t:CDS:2 [Diversispora eburnea]
MNSHLLPEEIRKFCSLHNINLSYETPTSPISSTTYFSPQYQQHQSYYENYSSFSRHPPLSRYSSTTRNDFNYNYFTNFDNLFGYYSNMVSNNVTSQSISRSFNSNSFASSRVVGNDTLRNRSQLRRVEAGESKYNADDQYHHQQYQQSQYHQQYQQLQYHQQYQQLQSQYHQNIQMSSRQLINHEEGINSEISSLKSQSLYTINENPQSINSNKSNKVKNLISPGEDEFSKEQYLLNIVSALCRQVNTRYTVKTWVKNKRYCAILRIPILKKSFGGFKGTKESALEMVAEMTIEEFIKKMPDIVYIVLKTRGLKDVTNINKLERLIKNGGFSLKKINDKNEIEIIRGKLGEYETNSITSLPYEEGGETGDDDKSLFP